MAALCQPIEIGDEPTALYHLRNSDDVVIYVGMTDCPAERMRRHAEEQTWWPEVARKTMVWYPTREEASAAETAAIRAENPCHNKRRLSNPNSSPRGPRLARAYEEKALAYDLGLPVELFPGGPVRRRFTAAAAGFK